MLERNAKQKLIISTASIASLLAVASLAGLLVWRASRLSAIESAVSERFAIGPFGLFELGKVPLDGGYQATIGFLPGLGGYLMLWVLLAGAYIGLRVKGQSSHKSS